MAKKQMKPVEVQGVRGYVDKDNVIYFNISDVPSGRYFKGKGLNTLGVALFGKLWKPIRPIPPQLACVYAAEMSDDTVKIGVSIHPDERIHQVANAVYLEVKRVHHTAFAPRSFMYDVENWCHAAFANRRVRGEFFNITFEEAVAELDSHADKIATALAKADQRYLAELDYFFNEYFPEYEKKQAAGEIMPSIYKQGFYSVYDKEIRRLECARVNFDGARARFECERMNLENARERLNDAVAEKNIATAKLLRELALSAADDELRNDLIRHAAKILVGEAFEMKRVVVQI